MAAIDFPSSPTVGQQFSAGNGATYEWTGVFWKVISSGPFLPLTGGILSGPLTVDGAAGTNRAYRASTNGVLRWEWGAGPVAETGASAGSDFFINAYSDSGVYNVTAMQINRATGAVGFGIGQFYTSLAAPTPAAATSDGNVATTNFVKTAGATATHLDVTSGVQTPIAAASTWYTSVSTGAIGAAGQKWRISGRIGVERSVTGQDYFVCQLWNGTTALDELVPSVHYPNAVHWVELFAFVTLSAATTFTLRASCANAGSGTINGGTRISAMRVG